MNLMSCKFSIFMKVSRILNLLVLLQIQNILKFIVVNLPTILIQYDFLNCMKFCHV